MRTAAAICVVVVIALLSGCGGGGPAVPGAGTDALGTRVSSEPMSVAGDAGPDRVTGTTVHVPADYAHVQAAIDAAPSGATIIISPGTYQETLDLKGKPLTLQSTSPGSTTIRQTTILSGSPSAAVVTAKHVSGGAATLRGLTITGGNIGVECYASTLTLDRCLIRSNTGNHGYGVHLEAQSGGTITGNTIQQNSLGIRCENASTPTISNNTIEANTGFGIDCYGSSTPTITGNVIRQNSNSGIYCSVATISGNQIRGNVSPGTGGGICCFGKAAIDHNLIVDNTASSYGGGVYCLANAVLINDTICHNSSRTGRGGNICTGDTSPIITNCIIALATQGGGIQGSGHPMISFNDVYGNAGGDYIGLTATLSGNISRDPLFVSIGTSGIYRLKSKAGHRNGATWVLDTVTSPCIDAGDRTSQYSLEPTPNGHRINLGFDGDTSTASKSG